MESRSAKQLLIPEGEGMERVKEADDVKLDVAEDTDKVDMEGEYDAGTRMTTGSRSSKHDRVYECGKGKEKVDESNVVQIIIAGDNDKGEKHHETPRTTRESLSEKGHDQDNSQGKENLKEADGVKLDVPEDTGDKGEEHPKTPGTTGESPPEKGHDKGKEKVNEANVVQIIIAQDNGEEHPETPGTTRESPLEKSRNQDIGRGKEKVNEANVVQNIIASDNDNGEEHPETLETTRESLQEKCHDQDNSKGKEKVNEANVVQIMITRDTDKGEEHLETSGTTRESLLEKGQDQDNVAQTLDDTPESLTAAQRHVAEVSNEPPHQKHDSDYARSLVERAKDKCYIYKISPGLRDAASDKHYEPLLLSIGPYHHSKTPLQDMEKFKVHYFQALLDRVKERSIARYIEALENEKGEPQAIHCYVDPFNMDIDTFGECMVLDGCFMIELFRRNMEPSEFNIEIWQDMIFNVRWMKPRLARDMLLFENQIPFFVLHRLFELTEERPSTVEFVKLALQYFQYNGRPIAYDQHLIGRLDDIPHLLGLVYNALVSKTAQRPNNEPKTYKPIKSAVALKEAGVKFVQAKNDAAFHEIGFNIAKGELSIPELVIEENTESLFRNLVAYEQYSKHYSLHRVVDYLQVMDCLVNSDKDVELLRHCEIIDNRVGADVKISTMFNNLCSGVYFDRTEFYYAQMFDDVNTYCKNPWNTRIATLKNDYLGRPWSIISFVAAVLLLLFPALQTVYTVSSYYQPKSKG